MNYLQWVDGVEKLLFACLASVGGAVYLARWRQRRAALLHEHWGAWGAAGNASAAARVEESILELHDHERHQRRKGRVSWGDWRRLATRAVLVPVIALLLGLNVARTNVSPNAPE